MGNYIGKTVTVYLSGGCYPGMGFSGILVEVNESYIVLVMPVLPSPFASSYNPFTNEPCRPCYYTGYHSYAYIPVDKIDAFEHYSL